MITDLNKLSFISKTTLFFKKIKLKHRNIKYIQILNNNNKNMYYLINKDF
jgi:hypothetical protein